MSKKSAYLIDKGLVVETPKVEGNYDHSRHFNVTETGKALVISGLAPTQSKTAAAPGDDDPEGFHHLCY